MLTPNLSKTDVIVSTVRLGLLHNLTWTTIVAFINMIFSMLGFGKKMTKNMLLKNINCLSGYQIHNFCFKCLNLLNETNVCNQCGELFSNRNSNSCFVTFGIKSQLLNMLNNEKIQTQLFGNRIQSNVCSGNLNGKMYKNLGIGPFDLSYSLNTDGCQATNSSKLSIWPVYLAINELPVIQRNRNMILAGLWVNERQPDISSLLQPIIKELNILKKTGVMWNYRNKVKKSKFIPTFCSVDSCARSMILAMKKFNGKIIIIYYIL